MPYTERQLHCLSAMGLVAWRARTIEASGSSPPAPPESSALPEPSSPSAAEPARSAAVSCGSVTTAPSALPSGVEPLAQPALATPLPREPTALAAWLPSQPLAPFTWKGRWLTRIGRDDAPLLVVVEREPAETLPLVGEAAELFERMLGSIGRTRRDTCQCVIANAPQPDGDRLDRLVGSHRRATLVLLQELDGSLDADGCRLPEDAFGGPAWCLPHPERLLAEPLGKRQAWLVLKALRRHLTERS